MTCRKCGGTLRGDHCNLCELFATGRVPGGHAPACWPMDSVALSVHRKQVKEANERNKKHGLTSYYREDGTCVLPDRNERKKLLRLEKLHDNSGGYSD